MEILERIEALLIKTPAWAVLYALPACLTAAAVAFVFVKKRAGFYAVALPLCALGFVAVFLRDKTLSVLYLCAFLALTGALSLLFFIPRPFQKKRPKKTREEKIYEKFHEELSERSYAPQAKMPAKVCCFEEKCDYEETNDMRLSYAETLLKKLRAQKLNAGDRLETDELARRLGSYKKKSLTEEERGMLNDCLASVLKLTAKYQL